MNDERAFPTNTINVPFDDADNPKYLGMSLRDYFAAAALQGMYASDTPESVIPLEQKAKDSYKAADAMMEARKQ